METASIIAILLFVGLIATAGYLIFRHEKKFLKQRQELAKLLGAKFEGYSNSLDGTPLEEIEILNANRNSRAQSLISQSNDSFYSFHFLLSYGTPPGASVKGSANSTAAAFKLKSSAEFPSFSFGADNPLTRRLIAKLGSNDEILELGNNQIARFAKGSLKANEIQKLLDVVIPTSFLPNGIFLRGDGKWLFAQTSAKVNFEDWIRGTTDVVEQIIKNKERLHRE
jgi:hypothetical protein